MVVEPTNYGRFDLFRFLLPLPYFRKKAEAEVLRQLQIVEQRYPSAKISVIAHSFGTYLIGKIIANNFNVKFDKVIFCGCVLRYNFPFEDYQNRFSADIVNEVGTKDIWPAMAESVTTGYGSAGTFGFHRPLVYDRWHNGAHHGYFLNQAFCKKYWVPFLLDGTIVPDSAHPERPSRFASIINIVKLKYLLSAALVCALLWLPAASAGIVPGIGWLPWPHEDACPGLPGETAWVYAGEFDQNARTFTSKAVFSISGADRRPEDVRRGDWIELTSTRKTMIIDYSKTGQTRALDSPFSLNGHVDYTCKTLPVGQRLYVVYIDVNGPSKSESHMWLRVRYSPPGGGDG